MRGVKGQWALEVIGGGQDLELDPSVLTHFYIINNIQQHLPSLNFGMKDFDGKKMKNLLVDGAPISVSVGVPEKHMYNNLNFLAMGMPKVSSGGGQNQIGVNAIFETIKWVKKVVEKNYDGTAASVIAQIAAEAGLRPEVDSTNDNMTWLPNRKTLAQFAHHVMGRSFTSATSAAVMAVCDKGILKFKDIDTLIGTGPKKQLTYHGEGGTIPIHNYYANPKSLVASSGQGYGTTSLGFLEDGSIFEMGKVAMNLMSAITAISSIFQAAAGELGSRINVLAPLSGNTHDMWDQALHQNPRIKASYAYDVEVLTLDPTDLDLLDVAHFEPLDHATGKVNKQLVGKYIVTATTKLLMNNRYVEKIVLTSQGVGGV